MSESGYKQTSSRPKLRSACPPTTDIRLGQIQVPACRRRDGFADIIKVAGIGLVHVALVNERLNHLAGHQNPRHEDAMAAPLAVPALALGCGGGSGVILVNLVTGPRQIAVAYQPRGVALDGAESIKRMLGSS